jgi:ribonuclease Z
MLFDLGRLDRLSVREILKLSDVFVSHTHIDHFIGFDHLLSSALHREQDLQLFGPNGFMENVRGKLAGYAWNLIRDYPFTLVVHEVDGPSKKSYDPKLRLEHKAFSGTLALSLDNPGRDKL